MVQEIDDMVSIHRLQAVSETSANIVHHNRKRKCQGEKLEQPTTKHKCYTVPSSTSDVEYLERNSHATSSQAHPVIQKIEFMSPSELDSVKDSNSLPARSESITSSYGQAKSDPECSNAYVYRDMVRDEYGYSCNSAAADGQLGNSHIEEDEVLESEMHGHCIASECENDTMEVGEDDDLDGLLYSDCSKVDPNMFVLSSGRWIVNRDTQSMPMKPTIDQEFEQYFSTLML